MVQSFKENPATRAATAPRQSLTVFIYLCAAVGASFFWLSRNERDGRWSSILVPGLFLLAPLLFVFAYPRFLFAVSANKTSRQLHAGILHGLGAVLGTVLFVALGSEFWKNPLNDADSIGLLLIPLVAVPVFFVAGFALLLKGKSTLAKFGSFLFWPYWLISALAFVGRYFEATDVRTGFCFLCLSASALFAFAAGAVFRRPVLAHAMALAGLVGVPWIYWTALQGTVFRNDWTMFNVPDEEYGMYHALPIAALTIASVALIFLAIGTAALRLMPSRWKLRGTPLCLRTWPALVGCVLFLAIWFVQSVMPYRIPGALDYGRWPVLHTLHVEKHGLRFHETCIRVSREGGIYVSENHRRLFQYRFVETNSGGKLSPSLMGRVQSIVHSPEFKEKKRLAITPVRSWNADNWYLQVEGSQILAYTPKSAAPPAEIVALFNDLEASPRSSSPQSTLKDICLGFCYDPIAGLGYLYANHRCSHESNRVVCR